jgi:uncharacterized protein YwgA
MGLRQIESKPYHWPTGRTILQKITYVATREGLPTGFHYERGSFGPFSRTSSRTSKTLRRSWLTTNCFKRKGGMFVVKVGPNFERC